jgi:hypothetical protein
VQRGSSASRHSRYAAAMTASSRSLISSSSSGSSGSRNASATCAAISRRVRPAATAAARRSATLVVAAASRVAGGSSPWPAMPAQRCSRWTLAAVSRASVAVGPARHGWRPGRSASVLDGTGPIRCWGLSEVRLMVPARYGSFRWSPTTPGGWICAHCSAPAGPRPAHRRAAAPDSLTSAATTRSAAAETAGDRPAPSAPRHPSMP